jgi:ATP-dependent Clp protease ATP-binding subunit ClpA
MGDHSGADLTFTEEAREVLQQARELAAVEGAGEVRIDHLLLGVVRCPQSRAHRTLKQMGVDTAELERALAPALGARASGAAVPEDSDWAGAIPFDGGSQRVLQSIITRTKERGGSEVDSSDLLVGISELTVVTRPSRLFHGTPQAAELLHALGVDANRIETLLGR